jgi:hypothetical protein
MYPKVLLANHWMEDNLEIRLEEVHLKELGGPPFNPVVGSYRCPTPNPHMFNHHGINNLLYNL